MPLSLQSALEASGYVGTWETDLDAQIIELSGALPRLMALDEARAAQGLPVSAFIGGVHPEDQERVSCLVREAHRTGGRFEAEFRTRDKAGATHWVIARGRIQNCSHGKGARCIGVVVDVTESRQDDPGAADQTLKAIERIADALIAIRPLAGGLEAPILKTLIDAALFELGRLLAERENDGGAASVH